MNTLVTILVTAAATGVMPTTIAVLGYRQATAANRQTQALENRKVDAEAFMNAQAIYKDAIATLETQLRSARDRITELERRLGGLEGRSP